MMFATAMRLLANTGRVNRYGRASRMRDMIVAQLALWRASGRVRNAALGRLVETHARSTGSVQRDPHTPREPMIAAAQGPGPAGVRAMQLADALVAAAAWGPMRPRCLARSIALHELLEAHGITGSEVCVGVRRESGKLAAHAWVEFNDTVLGDDIQHVRGYTRLRGLGVRSFD